MGESHFLQRQLFPILIGFVLISLGLLIVGIEISPIFYPIIGGVIGIFGTIGYWIYRIPKVFWSFSMMVHGRDFAPYQKYIETRILRKGIDLESMGRALGFWVDKPSHLDRVILYESLYFSFSDQMIMKENTPFDDIRKWSSEVHI